MKSTLLVFGIAIVCLFGLALFSIVSGAVPISIMGMLRWSFGINPEALTSTEQTILMQLRLPRVITACLVGGSLGIAGVGFQGLFRNPLADPYVIGASSGAGLGVTLAVVAGLRAPLLGLSVNAAWAAMGALISVALVFAIGSIGRRTSALTLLLAGVAVSSMINALSSLLMYMNDNSVIVIMAWLMGCLATNGWDVVLATSIASALSFGLLWGMSRPMDLFLLGDSTSQSLGLDLFRFRFLLVVGSTLATASAVSAAGIIGFVGLIAPHIARRLIGPRHFRLLPLSACVGAAILIFADVVARTIVAPAELPVGILTALLGCPFFLFLLLTRCDLPEDSQ